MANEVKIILSAVDKASAVIGGVGKSITGLGTASTGANQAVGMITTALTGMGALMIADKIMDAGRAIKALADDYMNYAMQVKQANLEFGGSMEQMSRLIQVADDVGLSWETMQTAMRAAVRKGLEPTAEGIAKLSDAYLALQPGIERTKFLMDNFGRSGAEIAKFMSLGSDAIIEMSASVKDNLVVTEEAYQKSEKYRLALDELQDSVTGVKNEIGLALIPVLSDLVGSMNDLIAGAEAGSEALEKFYTLLGISTGGASDFKDALGELAGAIPLGGYTMLLKAIGAFSKAEDAATLKTAQATDVFQRHSGIAAFLALQLGLIPPELEEITEENEKMIKSIGKGGPFLGISAQQAAQFAFDLKWAAREADNLGKAAPTAAEKWEAAFGSLDMGIGSAIEDSIKKIDFAALGGAAFDDMQAGIQRMLAEGLITPDDAKAAFANLLIAYHETLVLMGDEKPAEALANLSEALKGIVSPEQLITLKETLKTLVPGDLEAQLAVITDFLAEIKSPMGGEGKPPIDLANLVSASPQARQDIADTFQFFADQAQIAHDALADLNTDTPDITFEITESAVQAERLGSSFSGTYTLLNELFVPKLINAKEKTDAIAAASELATFSTPISGAQTLADLMAKALADLKRIILLGGGGGPTGVPEFGSGFFDIRPGEYTPTATLPGRGGAAATTVINNFDITVVGSGDPTATAVAVLNEASRRTRSANEGGMVYAGSL